MGNFKTGFENAPPKINTGSKGSFATGFGGDQVTNGGIAGGPATASIRKGGGGIGGFLGSVAHWTGSKLSMAGHDIAAMPGGVYQVSKAAAHDAAKLSTHIPGGNSPSARRMGRGKYELPGVGKAFLKSTEETIKHPLRDPFATGLTVAPAVGMIGRVGEAGLAARGADVAAGESRLGEAAKALARRHGQEPPRVLKSGGRVVKKNGTTMRIDGKDTNLIPSRNAGVRLAQRGYDRAMQKALDKQAQAQGVGRVTSRVAEHAQKRIGGALAEEQRAIQRMNSVPADRLERSALHLSKLPLKAGGKIHSAALELTSTQTAPEDAALFHEQQALKLRDQAAKAENPEQAQKLMEAVKRNEGVASLYRKVHENGLVQVDNSLPEGQRVSINPAKKNLAHADAALAHAGQVGEQMIAEHNLMSPEGQAQRINAPGQVRAGAEYTKPTPGKLGVPSHIYKEAQAQVAKLEKLHARAALKAMGDTRSQAYSRDAATSAMPYEYSPTVQRLSSALSVAKDRLQKLEEAHNARIEPTGLVGGETANPGRNFVGYRASEKTASPRPISVSQGKTIGESQSPIDSKAFTGENIRQGFIPKNVALSAARHYRQIAKFVNTDALRRSILEHDGSPLKRSPRDILIRVPGGGAKPLADEMKQALGQARSAVHDQASLDEINAGTQEGLRALHQFFNQRILDQAESSKAAGIGTRAPQGYQWVDSHLAQALQKDAMPQAGGLKSLPGKVFDNTNSAITAMTVYFKVGHTFTRTFTNAATNIMQGSGTPESAAKAYAIWDKLSPEDRMRAVAAAGQQGFAALPHEGSEGLIGRTVAGVARGGSRFWARHADAPFRFNSLAYELRKVGYDTPDKFRSALDAIQSGGKGLPAHEWSKVSAAFRRADREAISYDRLNEFEKRYLTRAIWFYPWVKGSSLFTVRSMLEHPLKSAALGQAGVRGREQQLRTLGPVPSYEQGLIALGGGAKPNTVDMSTFSPMATLGQLLNAPEVPGSLSQQFNPVLGSGIQYATGTNQYGEPSNNPLGDALSSLVAPTPEAQIADAIQRGHQNTSQRMFPGMNWKAELERYALGPGLAKRRVNKAALAKAAAREHAKRYTVYGK